MIAILAAVVYLPTTSKYLKLRWKEKELDEQITKLEKQIKMLKEEEHLLTTDPARLEEVAREELGLVKPGEIVYKAVEETVRSK